MTKPFILTLLVLCTAWISDNFRLLEPLDFERSLRQNPEAVVLDLRDIESYEKGHIKGAIVIDFLRDDFREYFLGKYKKDQPLYIYGQSAHASENTGLYISELGYTNVNVLKGGFENWIRSSRPYKSAGKNFTPLSYISKQNYFQILKEKKWVLIVFKEDYCPYCDKMENSFKELLNENADLSIRKINLQTNGELSEWQGVTKNSTLILYKDGIQYWKSTEEPDKQNIQEHIF